MKVTLLEALPRAGLLLAGAVSGTIRVTLGVGASHVGIGVAPDDHEEAERRLRDAGIIIVPHEEESGA
jgi:hypothetical protein